MGNVGGGALDIKTLTTLIMVTPKTDIEQAVGRILRERHGTPVVVDIIDTHTPFQNQWNKRQQFYKKQNYKIIRTRSDKYTKDTSTWKVIFDPSLLCGKASKDITLVSEDNVIEGGGKCLIKLPKKQC